MYTPTLQATIERACESAQIVENILRDDALTDEQQRELIDVLVLDDHEPEFVDINFEGVQ